MKRQLIILLFFTLQLSAQNKDPNHHFPVEKISVPCTKDFINNYEGKWLIHKNELATNSVKEYSNEALKRLNAMNDLVREIYPQPTGSDAEWQGTFNKTSFADQVKYVMNQNNMLNEEHVKINPVYRYLYRFDLYPWNCKGPDEIMNGYPVKEGFTQLSIDANLATILPGNFLDGNEWTTDGRPIKKKLPVLEKWKGYDMCTSQGGAYVPLVHDRFVLITRPGELPYVPVTRQQFFDRAIRYVTRYWDEAIASTNVFSDKTQVEELKKDNAKAKKDALQRLLDELDKTTKQGLLNSPAIICGYDITMTTGPVFSTEEDGGNMLVTENPNYFRKNLPVYVPQFFVLTWSWDDDGWALKFRKEVEQNFPIEKLQSMIDK